MRDTNNKTYGAFTNILWGNDGAGHRLNGSTFLFRFDSDEKLIKFPYKNDSNAFEVNFSTERMFEIYDGFYVETGNDEPLISSKIPSQFKVEPACHDEDIDCRNIGLTGFEQQRVHGFELYQVK